MIERLYIDDDGGENQEIFVFLMLMGFLCHCLKTTLRPNKVRNKAAKSLYP